MMVLRMINTALAIALAVAIACFCFAFSSGVAEAQGIEPATTGSVSVADDIHLWVSIAQGVATIIAIVLGGFFAWRRGFIFRHEQPHVTISHDVTHRQIGHGYVHVEVTATLHNSSRVKIEFRDGLFTMEQLAPLSYKDVERLFEKLFEKDLYESPKWNLLIEQRLEWSKDELIVEPGEKITATFEHIISNAVESVLITTYFYNTRVMEKVPATINPREAGKQKRLRWLWQISGPRGWIRTTAHDINLVDDHIESRQKREGKSDG